MEPVRFDRVWIINTPADYFNALDVLNRNEFAARMSDCYDLERREKDEIARQRDQVRKAAVAAGIIDT